MWQNKRKRSGPTFPELLWILRSFFKVALGSLWITKRLFVKLMLPRAVAKKNGRSCRVWIFCVSCVHEDALCTLMIYHGGLMCHQTFNSFAQKNNQNFHSNVHSKCISIWNNISRRESETVWYFWHFGENNSLNWLSFALFSLWMMQFDEFFK